MKPSTLAGWLVVQQKPTSVQPLKDSEGPYSSQLNSAHLRNYVHDYQASLNCEIRLNRPILSQFYQYFKKSFNILT